MEVDIDARLIRVCDEMMVFAGFTDHHIAGPQVVGFAIHLQLRSALQNNEDLAVVCMHMPARSIAGLAGAADIMRALPGDFEADAAMAQVAAWYHAG